MWKQRPGKEPHLLSLLISFRNLLLVYIRIRALFYKSKTLIQSIDEG